MQAEHLDAESKLPCEHITQGFERCYRTSKIQFCDSYGGETNLCLEHSEELWEKLGSLLSPRNNRFHIIDENRNTWVDCCNTLKEAREKAKELTAQFDVVIYHRDASDWDSRRRRPRESRQCRSR
jgi:hypothetical protein